MNSRERFLATMQFDPTVAPPLYEFGYWAATVRRWYKEGLERDKGLPDEVPGGQGVGGSFPLKEVPCEDVEKAINLDHPTIRVPVEVWIFPYFEEQIIEEEGDGTLIVIDKMGIKKKINKDNDSIPQYYAWPVRCRDDWEKLKTERLNAKNQGRYPNNIDSLIKEYKDRSYPLTMGGPPVGFFGSLRYLMGEVNLFYSFYDQPDLIKNIIDYLVDFWIELFSPLLKRIKIDCFHMWEDMCYKSGPLISPELFREFMLPAYRRFTDFLRSFGVENIFCDTDGNCWQLIPLFLEGGVTGLYPMEVASNMNVVEIRKSFPKLQITGGIDKRALIQGKKAIDKELESKIPYMLKYSGYIPHIDHNVPPDVSWENFIYYRKKLEKMIKDHFE